VLTALIYAAHDDYLEVYEDEIERSRSEHSLLLRQIDEAERNYAKSPQDSLLLWIMGSAFTKMNLLKE